MAEASANGRRKRTWRIVVAISLILAGCEKARLDEQVRQLCVKDGGIRVFETVRLPANKLDQWGLVDFFKPAQGENALGPEYKFARTQHYYRKGNPEMSRTQYQIFRRSDGKLLGETVIYGRGGGDLPSPMHGSSFSCPSTSEAGEIALLKQIFVTR